MNSRLKSFLAALLCAVLVMGYFGYQKYQAFFLPNVPLELESEYVHIPTGASFEDVLQILESQGFIKDRASFIEVAERLKYKKEKMRSGRYKIENGINNLALVRHLRGGKQAPVDVILTNARLLEEIAGKVSKFIEPDSATLYKSFSNPENLKKYGYTIETVPALFIPNTYELFWNTSADGFMERMNKENGIFWKKNDRLAKAEKLKLSPTEVYTLASIVEKETNQNSEKKRMAGVYYNRLEIGMLLQADPTCVFATKDFAVRRVLNYHKNFDSPYNTYVYKGLPPGPISMASMPSIDAVLNHEKHKYLYFCAKPDGSGFHSFAKNLAQHNVNAKAYHRSIRNRK